MECRKEETGDGGGEGRENDIVIHPTVCHKLRLKDAKLQAQSLPRVRYCSSNKVNNCFTLMHTLVLLEAKLLSCCSWYCGTLCRQGRARKLLQRSQTILTKRGTPETLPCCYLHKTNRLAFICSGSCSSRKKDHERSTKKSVLIQRELLPSQMRMYIWEEQRQSGKSFPVFPPNFKAVT